MAIESPTYVQAYETFLNLGYQVCAVEMDAQGISMEQLRSEKADIAYVMLIPSVSNGNRNADETAYGVAEMGGRG